MKIKYLVLAVLFSAIEASADDFALFKWVEKEVLSSLSREGFTLLLKHRPLVAEDALGLFDLQLSGHAHKGQIFPATLLVEAIYPTAAGFLRLEKGSCLYVSRGAGTWGPPIRFLASPEVTVIELVYEGTS